MQISDARLTFPYDRIIVAIAQLFQIMRKNSRPPGTGEHRHQTSTNCRRILLDLSKICCVFHLPNCNEVVTVTDGSIRNWQNRLRVSNAGACKFKPNRDAGLIDPNQWESFPWNVRVHMDCGNLREMVAAARSSRISHQNFDTEDARGRCLCRDVSPNRIVRLPV